MESLRIVTRRLFLLSSATVLARGRKLERFDPSHLPAPAIVMLYGAGGPDSRRFPSKRYARRLARSGFVVLLPTYGGANSGLDDWIHEIMDLLNQIPSEEGIASQRVGVLGSSQGGGLALVIASRRPEVRAVVVWSGNVPDDRYHDLNTLPPTLLLHGSQDGVIPLTDAQQVSNLCTRRDLPCELTVLTGEGHGFVGSGERRAIMKTTEFF